MKELEQICDYSVKEVMKSALSILFMTPYDTEADFYEQFDVRLKKCIGVLRKIN